jgi:hypothetical protein
LFLFIFSNETELNPNWFRIAMNFVFFSLTESDGYEKKVGLELSNVFWGLLGLLIFSSQ